MNGKERMSYQDAHEIMRIINLYGFAVDAQLWDLFDEIFTQDVGADYCDGSSWQDLATFKADLATYHDPFDGTQHAMMNHVVNLQGHIANALTYGSWRLIRKGLDGGDTWQGGGWYDDQLILTDYGWRISVRTCRIIWWEGNSLVAETSPSVKFQLPMKSLRADRLSGDVHFFNGTD